ncbi:unnamed protein product [Somion occarium]|uniref:Uncharacterized protein n=1 Tax=Somion occarium TaxID=3059160 RepID=A0ABP1E1L3_9APHY
MPFWRKHLPFPSQDSQPTSAAGPSSQTVPPPPLPVHTVPAPGTHLPPPPQTRPRTIKLSPGRLLSLPYRLLHPPPAKSQLPTWSITPQFDIKLEDILDRKHLPPLGLKDFEEWMLFVEHNAEYLYFILWLREYTSRYAAWKQHVKHQQQHQQQQHAQRQPQLNASSAPTSHPTKKTRFTFSNSSHKSRHEGERDRDPPTFSRHNLYSSSPRLSISSSPSISTSSSIHTHSSRPSSSHSSHSGSPTPLRKSSTHPSHLSHSSRSRSKHQHVHIHGTSITVPPSPPVSLATFYMRAKETFLTKGSAYELHVHEDVLVVFHLSSCPSGSSENFGMSFPSHYPAYPTYPSHSAYSHSAYLSQHHSNSNNRDQTLPLPPDPEIFAELKGIVEDRLKACLGRFVVATYNNVGTPRAWCGSAGGIVIGTGSSVPILASNFALHAPRWWRIFALPGMWLGMTIFLSAMYGVCMMIYVFGDLRQLRSFELSRPSGANRQSRSGEKEAVVVQPITRPPKVRLVDSRDRTERTVEKEKIKEELKSRWSSDTTGVQSPAPLVIRGQTRVDGQQSFVSRSRSSHSYSEDSDTESEGSNSDSESEASSSSEQHSDSNSDTDSDSDSDPSTSSSLSAKPTHTARRPRILISDAFYDEHPSPEGFATSTGGSLAAPFVSEIPGGIAVRRGSLPGQGGGSQLRGGEDVGGATATASFIRGYIYDEGEVERLRGYRFGSHATSSHAHSYEGDDEDDRSSSHGVGGDDEEDIEAQRQARVAERQPVDEFDFDGLPPRMGPFSSPSSIGSNSRSYYSHSQYPQYPQYPQYSQYSQYPEHAYQYQYQAEKNTTATAGGRGLPGEEDGKRHSLVVVVVWMLVSWIQVKCSPGNAAAHHLSHSHSSPSTFPKAVFEEKLPQSPSEKQQHLMPFPNTTNTNTKLTPYGNNTQSAQPVNAKVTKPKVETMSWRESFRRVSAVPAFASPLTPVLNPIVGRAQWEIVVRSAVISAVVCGSVVGALMGVPVSG